MKLLPLIPSVKNPKYWYPNRISSWNKIRKKVLERDKFTCRFCGHKAKKYMSIHHIGGSLDNSARNLVASCVACHAIHHIGLNLALGLIEIWESKLSQRQIVKITRKGKKVGKSLRQIKKELPLKRGPFGPQSMNYANYIIRPNSRRVNFYLPDPLRVVFTRIKRWQIDNNI